MKRMNFIFCSGVLIFLLLVVGLDFATAAKAEHGKECKVLDGCMDADLKCQKDGKAGAAGAADTPGTAAVDADCPDPPGPNPCMCVCADATMPYYNTGDKKCQNETAAVPPTAGPDEMSSSSTTTTTTANPGPEVSTEATTPGVVVTTEDEETTTSGSDRIVYEPASLKLGMAAMGSFLGLLLCSS